jgi:hypothetical protein
LVVEAWTISFLLDNRPLDAAGSNRMNDNEVQALARALQTSLSQQTPSSRLSRSASLTESGSILAVVHSLRTACLLSVLPASQSVITALQDALVPTKGIAIVVHEPSQQVFILNLDLFQKRWCDAGHSGLFYAIDSDGREDNKRIEVS